MKLNIVVAAAALLTAGATAQYTIQSPPFNLHLSASDDSSVDGSYLYACHAGAAIEGLCLGTSDSPGLSSPSGIFYHNSSDFSGDVDGNPIGLLTWNLAANVDGAVVNVSSPMALSYNDVSNVAVPLLMPQQYGTSVVFDAEDKLALVSAGDDTSNNSTGSPAGGAEAYYRWHACWASTGGYYYHVLAWVMAGEPTNPSCVGVEVAREFL